MVICPSGWLRAAPPLRTTASMPYAPATLLSSANNDTRVAPVDGSRQSAMVSSAIGPAGLGGPCEAREDLPSLRSIPQNESSSGVVRNRIGMLAGWGPEQAGPIGVLGSLSYGSADCQLRVVEMDRAGTRKAAGRVCPSPILSLTPVMLEINVLQEIAQKERRRLHKRSGATPIRNRGEPHRTGSRTPAPEPCFKGK